MYTDIAKVGIRFLDVRGCGEVWLEGRWYLYGFNSGVCVLVNDQYSAS